MNIYQAFVAAAATHHDRLAVWDDDSKISFGELLARSRRSARALLAAGVQKGDRVAIWAVNHLQWIEAALGVQAAGGVIIPLGTRLRGPEVASILERTGVKLLFCDAGFGDYSFPAAVAKHALPALQKVVVFGDDAVLQPGAVGFAGFLRHADQVSEADLDARIASISPEDLVDIIFTSGTTGLPKGVPMTHRQSLVACRQQQLDIANFQPGDVFPVIFAFAHNAGYRAGWQVSLLYGVTIVPVRSYDGAAVLRLFEKVRPTYVPAPPPVFRAILDDPHLANIDLSCIRLAQTGGTDVPVELVRDMRARLGVQHVITGYGLTEAAGSVTSCRPGDADEIVTRTAGVKLTNLDVAILDEAGQPVSVGEKGEVAVRGEQVLHGYLDDPEATQKAFTADGFFRTGDIGWFDEAGNLSITGRLKDMYLVGGFNCYPAEIERILRQLDGVLDAAVVAVPDTRLGQVGRAFIVRQSGAELTETQVIAWSKDMMANYKVPRSVVFLDELPRNAQGKVLKTELR